MDPVILKDLNLLDVVALICFSLEVHMILLSNPFLLWKSVLVELKIINRATSIISSWNSAYASTKKVNCIKTILRVLCAAWEANLLWQYHCSWINISIYKEKTLIFLIIFVLALTMFINCASVKWATRIQDSFTFGKLIALAILIVIGLIEVGSGKNNFVSNLFTP